MSKLDSIDAIFSTSKDLEEKGAPYYAGGGVIVYCRRGGLHRPKFAMILADLTLKYSDPQTGEISEEDNSVMTAKLLSKYVVSGWEGVFDGDGNPIEYTEEIGFEKFKKHKEFANDVFLFCQNRDNYKEKLGNS